MVLCGNAITIDHFSKESKDMDSQFSPFDAPLQGSKKIVDVPYEEIHDTPPSQAGGSTFSSEPSPKDAPPFEVPNYDDVPTADMGDFGGGIDGDTSSGDDDTIAPPDGFNKEFSQYTAKWLVDIYFKLFLTGVKEYAKIDRREVQKAVHDGLIDERFLKFVDEANDNVENELNISDEEKEFIIEPLQFLLDQKKIQFKPEYMVLASLVIVSGSVFMNAQDIKNQNAMVIDKIVEESKNIRQDKTPKSQPEKEEPTPTASMEDFTLQNESGEAEFVDVEVVRD